MSVLSDAEPANNSFIDNRGMYEQIAVFAVKSLLFHVGSGFFNAVIRG